MTSEVKVEPTARAPLVGKPGGLLDLAHGADRTALKELTAQGKVTRREDGMWVLHGQPPVELGQMYATLS